MIEIPNQLKKPEFRFIPLEGKIPIEKDWTKRNYTYDDPKLQEWLKIGKNYGVVCGYGNLLVIDIDNPTPEFMDLFTRKMPPTFTIRTGRGGYHFYYITEQLIPSKKLDIGPVHIDIQSIGKQVVGPNSIHPQTNKKYEIINNVEISELPIITFYEFFAKHLVIKNEEKKEADEKYLLELLEKILKKVDYVDKGNYYLIHCPFHPPDIHPSFVIYKNTKLGVDFHDNQIYLLVDIARRLGIEIKQENKKQDEVLQQITIKEHFSPVYFAEPILKKYRFLYDRFKRFWRYDPDEGVWKEDAEEFLASLLREKILTSEQQKRYYVNEIISYIKDISYKEIIPETPKHIIAFKNRVYDIENDVFLDFHPDLFLTNKIPVSIYDEIKDCPKIDAFFEELVGKEKKIILYELIAYTLYRDYPYQKVFYLYGSGSNGKSTFLDLLVKFLGRENVSSETPHDLISNRFSPGNLFNKLANISSDISYSMLKNPNMIKMLTGGDYIKCERKFKDAFPFRNYAKLIFSTNLLPPTNDKSFAYYRRLYLIEFPNKFVDNANPNLLEELTTPEELSGLAWKSIIYLKRLKERKWRFTIDPKVEDIEKVYENLSNPVKMFIDENCEEDPDGFIYVQSFYRDFKIWSKRKGLPILGNNEVSRMMEEMGFFKKAKGEQRRWAFVGIKWKTATLEQYNTSEMKVEEINVYEGEINEGR